MVANLESNPYMKKWLFKDVVVLRTVIRSCRLRASLTRGIIPIVLFFPWGNRLVFFKILQKQNL